MDRQRLSSHPHLSQQNVEDNIQPVSMAALAAALSDVSRVKIICALMDGRAWTATELSVIADIAPSTTSAHLARLLKEALISCLSQGRHRYYRLAGADVANLVETLMGVSWKRIEPPKSRTPIELKQARTCYDHLAGELAVNIYDALLSNQWLEKDGQHLSPLGKQKFADLGLNLQPKTKRKYCCPCLDWSERKYHLGGHLGAELFSCFENRGWLIRVSGYRMVNISKTGRQAFKKLFAITV
ncbi:ArsR/SmtB family transcription factor [Agarivorans sp. QJM3NY_33]|uniref:ArsR/SmtB family transcription factor n=1 Tax=Agarivorans sp. QJM3NY_33 TaxID=3421432 RepID=UPI003D7CFDB3